MRKVINGRTYNTATSKLIGSDPPNNLYKNSKGGYFVYSSQAKKITPKTPEEAQSWAKRHLKPEEYEAEFGETVEPASDLTTRERVNLTLDAEMMANLRKLSNETGVPMARMVDKAIMAMYGDQFKK